ncbi:MAG: O-acetyl-ADP-ribose deacetylase [Bacteroidota bacterium]
MEAYPEDYLQAAIPTLGERLQIMQGDITELTVDAIVNAANSSLMGGGGVDGAIHKAAGRQLLEECRKLKGCETGEAKITKGYRLPARHVIHAVGPVWYDGSRKEDELLAGCYRNSLKLAVENGLSSMAFPSISTGAYRFPFERATRIALREVIRFLEQHRELQKVTMVAFSKKDFLRMERIYNEVVHRANQSVSE